MVSFGGWSVFSDPYPPVFQGCEKRRLPIGNSTYRGSLANGISGEFDASCLFLLFNNVGEI
eukprot:10844259-Prorocentrum_lima.AAC.1